MNFLFWSSCLALVMGCLLQPALRNKYGDIQYTEARNGNVRMIRPAWLDPSKVWVVKNPSYQCRLELFYTVVGVVERQYGPNVFVMSPQAALTFPEYLGGGGVACVVEVEHEGDAFYIMVADKKNYLQTCQGRISSSKESPAQSMARVLSEQLNIYVGPETLVPVGGWSVPIREYLMEQTWERHSTAFHLRLKSDQIGHLFPKFHPISKTELTVLPVAALPDLHSRGVDVLVFIPKASIDTAPETIAVTRLDRVSGRISSKTVTFDDHHRDFLRLRAGLSRKYPSKYLNSFKIATPQ